MHPPWIFLILLVTITRTSGNVKPVEEKGDEGNVTISRAQREIIERERRLIPYMTYYVTQNVNPNTPRQNIFIPVSSSRQNVLHYDSIPQIQANNIQGITPQQFEPLIRIQNPGYLQTPAAIQALPHRLQFKPKGEEPRVLGQYYRIQPQTQPQIHSQVAPQAIQAENQPRVIKINPVPIDQKLVSPQIIKIIPVVTKIPSAERTSKSYASSQTQYTYTDSKIQPLLPNTFEQNYYAGAVGPQVENPYQGNKVYAADSVDPQQTPLKVTRIIPGLRPDKTKYTLAKIFLTTTAPPPYSNTVKFELNDGVAPKFEAVNVNQQIPTSTSVSQPPINISPISSLTIDNQPKITQSQQQVYYAQKVNELNQVQPQKAEQYPRLKVPQEEDIKFVASVTPISVTNDLSNTPQTLKYDDHQDRKIVGVYKQPTLDDFLAILKDADKLPQNLTPDNIDNGIKTLALILERLQQQKNYQDLAKGLTPSAVSSTPKPSSVALKDEFRDHKKVHSFPQPSGTSTPGRPGIDYPIYSSIPTTKFDCSTQRYKGFFGDPDTKCQVWHYCDLNGGQASFLCPNGTIFSQVALTCDWWFNVKCASTSQLYVLNERLYKYILPFSPSFPEDYSGPVVDTYLAAKFKEMEAKSKNKALKSVTTTTKPETTTSLQSDTSTELVDESRTTSTEV